MGGNEWQREAMGFVTFGLGITSGTAEGKLKGKRKGNLKGKLKEKLGGNGSLCTSDNFEAGNTNPNS